MEAADSPWFHDLQSLSRASALSKTVDADCVALESQLAKAEAEAPVALQLVGARRSLPLNSLTLQTRGVQALRRPSTASWRRPVVSRSV